MSDVLNLQGKLKGPSSGKKSVSIGAVINCGGNEAYCRLRDTLQYGRLDVTLRERQDEDQLYEEDAASFSGTADVHGLSDRGEQPQSKRQRGRAKLAGGEAETGKP